MSQIKHKAEILILGDFNERMGEDANGMSSINAEFHLIDIMANRHPTLQEPATYAIEAANAWTLHSALIELPRQ
jgi:hypothetical protein